jgi:hypothetical protein
MHKTQRVHEIKTADHPQDLRGKAFKVKVLLIVPSDHSRKTCDIQ